MTYSDPFLPLPPPLPRELLALIREQARLAMGSKWPAVSLEAVKRMVARRCVDDAMTERAMAELTKEVKR